MKKARNPKKRKGFTLVEMLAVVAIIAILVAIITPIVNKSTVKSAAATNAANLRSVKGQLSVLRVSDPDKLVNSNLQDVEMTYNSVVGAIQGAINSFPDFRVIGALTAKLATLREDIQSKNAFYARDGKLQLNGITIEAPAAKALAVDGLDLRATTQMEVVITDNDIIVTYAGMPAEVFAIIAGEGENIDYSSTNHTFYDPTQDGVCDICNGAYPHTPDDIANGIIGGVVSGSHICSDTDGNCECDDPNCRLPNHLPNSKQICDRCGEYLHECVDNKDNDSYWGGSPDGLCDICDGTIAHECADNDKDHVCDKPGCNVAFGEHKHDSSTAEGHMCDYCGQKVSDHVANATGTNCTGCNATRTVCGCPNSEAAGGCGSSSSCKNCGHELHDHTDCKVPTRDWIVP